jgi:hypothetical protein
MARVLSSICLALALVICAGGVAWASKPKIAVLGIEVVPGPTGIVDPAMTQLARDLTKDLRQRAQSGASRYSLAPNSSKELTDEKLLMSCDDEATTCMAVIGAGLAADVMLYGHLERRGETYRVSLKLLDVKAKTVEQGVEDMPVGTTVASVAKKLYNKLIGDNVTVGSLVVKARVEGGRSADGRVMVDDQPRGELSSGTLTIQGLSEGSHTVAIESGGRYLRFEDRVVVRSGEQAVVDALLVDKGVPERRGRSGLWKVSLGAGIALAAAGGGFAYYSYDQMTQKQNGIFVTGATPRQSVTSEDCGKSVGQLETETMVNPGQLDFGVFQDACSWHSRIYIGYAMAGVGAVGAVVSLIMLTRDPPASEKPASARGKKSDVAITPVLTPGHAGAALSVRW